MGQEGWSPGRKPRTFYFLKCFPALPPNQKPQSTQGKSKNPYLIMDLCCYFLAEISCSMDTVKGTQQGCAGQELGLMTEKNRRELYI